MTWTSTLLHGRCATPARLASDGNGVRRVCLRLAGLAASMVVLSGCGGAPVGNVSGKVTYQGKPLPTGQITFFCEGGDKPVITRLIRDGVYSIALAPMGDARVAIATFPTTNASGPGGLKSPVPTDVPPPPSGEYVPIPTKYRSATTSGLKATVKRGDNPPFDFNLR